MMSMRLRIGTVALAAVVSLGWAGEVFAQHASRSLFDKILHKSDYFEGDAEPSPALLATRRQRLQAMMAVARADGKIDDSERRDMAIEAKQLMPTPDDTGYWRPIQHASSSTLLEKKIRLTKATSPEISKSRHEAQITGFVMAPEKDTPAVPRAPTSASKSPFRPEKKKASTDSDLFLEDSTGQYACDTCVEDLGCCDGTVYECGQSRGLWPWSGFDTLALFTTFDSFKGPLDLDNRNANFGVRFGGNLGFALLDARAIGVQIGTAETLADFHGTEYTGSTGRFQNFTTLGIFRRNPAGVGNLSWGFAYDWLYDNYYNRLSFGQWRVKLAYEWNYRNELGIWSVIPEHGDSAWVGSTEMGYAFERFKSIAQLNLYHTHHWDSGANTSCWVGWADEPGEVVLGADAEVPLGEHLAVIGGFQYIIPSANGLRGQDEDMWYTTVGIQWKPGRGGIGSHPGQYTPFMRLADNGIFSIRRR